MPVCVISAPGVGAALAGQEQHVVGLVSEAYTALAQGRGVNPRSSFLRFPDRPENRIIALPASLGPPFAIDGIKWISSVPGNRRRGLERASGVLILNDQETGVPFAFLEATQISSARTAASAVLAARHLHLSRSPAASVSFVGAGVIARQVRHYLQATGWEFDRSGVFDLDERRAREFADQADASCEVFADLESAIRAAELVVFATTAPAPYVKDQDWFSRSPVVLHLSLRDLAPEILLEAQNFVDDAEHCLREGTSAHLALDLSGSARFIEGTLADVLAGRLSAAADQTVVFSPFGLGVLDLAVASFVYRRAYEQGTLLELPDFFPGGR